MDSPPRAEGSRQQHADQYSTDVPVDLENISTLYIPKTDGGKTLLRRRRASSKRRSSSRRRHERENLEEMLYDEDNHLLPSLRIHRRARTKTMKGSTFILTFRLLLSAMIKTLYMYFCH